MRKLLVLLLFLFSFTFLIDQKLEYPAHFPPPIYKLDENPLDSLKIQLGRRLFHDPILSLDTTISCTSCHSPYNAFAHTDHDLSHGLNNAIGPRNAPAIFNMAWGKSFNWDGSVHHLDFQALAPINNPIEMGMTTEKVLDRLNSIPLYDSLFYEAFGKPEIETSDLLKAISQFILTLISGNSKYDRVKMGKESFTNQENNGYMLFKQFCNSCHVEPLFTTNDLANNQLAVDTSLLDYGRYTISQLEQDSFLFKIPSLRNLSYTYPYMHDGRFEKLLDVINHYKNISSKNFPQKKILDKPILISDKESIDLIAFLLTLNDPSFITNRKFRHPDYN